MPKRLSTGFYLCLALGVALDAAAQDSGQAASKRQQTDPQQGADQDAAATKPADAAIAPKKPAGRKKPAVKKKTERVAAARKKAERSAGFELDPPVVCESIDDYEDYKLLPGAAQTAEEKLLVYARPLGYQTEKVDKGYQAHLTADGEIRKKGEKTVLRQKKKLLDYQPVNPLPPRLIYLKHSISLKGLAPGDYELTLIVHDELAKGATATQSVKFTVIPPKDPAKAAKAAKKAKLRPRNPPGELDSMYAPFLDWMPDDDDL